MPVGNARPFGKQGAFIHLPVAVGIRQDLNFTTPPFVKRIAVHLDHVHQSVLIDFHGHRVGHQRFGGDQFDLKAGGKLKGETG